MDFWKGRQKKKKKHRKERNTLRQAFCGNKIDKKPLKMQKITILGYLEQSKTTETQRKKTQTTKTKKVMKKDTFLHSGKPPPIFVKFLFFYQSTFFHVYKAVFCWKHYKNSVFSGTQLLGITDSKTPFRGKPKMALLQPKVPFWVFPCVRWNPYFCSVWWLGMATKKSTIFPKQIVATKMRAFFYRLNTNSVCLFFLKMTLKKKPFSSQPPKNTIFLGFFWNLPLPFFSYCPFDLFQHKKDKNKKCTFFCRKPFFDTLTNC